MDFKRPVEAGVSRDPGFFPKDAHVLAAAVEGGSQFSLTLECRHILATADMVKRADLPIIILRPGDFIRNYYPKHEAYHRLPPTRS